MMIPQTPRHAPTTVALENGDALAVTPTDAVTWSEDYDAWICHYETSAPEIHEEFRRWRAVWSAQRSRWEPAEV